MSVTRPNGAWRIFRYNSPVYITTWAAAVVAILVGALAPAPISWALFAASIFAIGWSLVSLWVSWWVYDRSELLSGRWLGRVLNAQSPTQSWASVHAGLDAEVNVENNLNGKCVARLDIFDPHTMTAPSIARARKVTRPKHDSLACSATTLALADASCDVIVVPFTAHEIRQITAREGFFRELHRSLRPGGRVVLVEHCRDVANFLAFGPGFLHFLPSSEWLRLAQMAGFQIATETRITAWVTVLVLEKST